MREFGPIGMHAAAARLLCRILMTRRRGWLALAGRPLGRAAAAPGTVLRCARVWLRLARLVGLRSDCLMRSVMICALLRSNGVDARIAFGAATSEPERISHCWVEAAGEAAPPGWEAILRHP